MSKTNEDRFGTLPKTGWAKFVPELIVENLDTSLAFWRDLLGFQIAYQRSKECFVYLERPEGAQVMLCRRSGKWETGPLQRPFGRGVMFQIYVENADSVFSSVKSAKWPIYQAMREVWRRHGNREGGQREFFIQDPDGYLIMIAQSIGQRRLNKN